MNSRGTPSCMASARMPPVLVPAITWKSSRIRLPVRLSSSLSICSVRRPLRPPPSRESTAMVGCATSCDEGEHDGLPSMATAFVRQPARATRARGEVWGDIGTTFKTEAEVAW